MGMGINLKGVVKKYGENVILPDLNLTINGSEFFTLLGPSGCGKTTTLRIIAGFTDIQAGGVFFDGRDVSSLPSGKRNIGMVFQNYAIFPHMNVRQNVAFGLTNRHVPKAEINRRVDEVLKTVQIYDLRDRMPERMSGGQQQRVALARAIVIKPDLLLMDEPLSNLDAKLRIEMREVIRELHNDVGITTVYVTHDQEEAMAVSDRVAVMNAGVIQQIGTPRSIYHRPANIFVATFIGSTNILDGVMTVKNGKAVVEKNGYVAEIPQVDAAGLTEEKLTVKLSVRPEELNVADNGSQGLRGRITSSTYLGRSTNYFIKLESGETLKFTQESSEIDRFSVGQEITLSYKCEKINVFSQDGERNYCKGVVSDFD